MAELSFKLESGKASIDVENFDTCCGVSEATISAVRPKNGASKETLYRELYHKITSDGRGWERFRDSGDTMVGALVFTSNQRDDIKGFADANGLRPARKFRNPKTQNMISVYIIPTFFNKK